MFPTSKTVRRRGMGVGLLVVLLAVAIGLILLFGQLGDKSHVETALDARKKAIKTVERVNLATVFRALLQYAAMNEDQYPPSVAELTGKCAVSADALASEETGGVGLVYLPGQNRRMAKTNILAYQISAVDEEQIDVLRLDGRVETLSPDQLEAALYETREALR